MGIYLGCYGICKCNVRFFQTLSDMWFACCKQNSALCNVIFAWCPFLELLVIDDVNFRK